MIVFHICGRTDYRADVPYRARTLDAEGFIHCSTAEQVVGVATARFRGERDLVLLAIDTERLDAPLRWEPADGDRFPHVYGAIAPAAVRRVIPFPPSRDGSFELPEAALG